MNAGLPTIPENTEIELGNRIFGGGTNPSAQQKNPLKAVCGKLADQLSKDLPLRLKGAGLAGAGAFFIAESLRFDNAQGFAAFGSVLVAIGAGVFFFPEIEDRILKQ